MQSKELPCKQCLKRPACMYKTKVECSDLFFDVMDEADFDEEDHVVNSRIKRKLKAIFPNCVRIVPGEDWLERTTQDDTMRKMHSASCVQDKTKD